MSVAGFNLLALKLVSDFTAKVQFGDLLLSRRLKFLNGLTLSDNAVFEFLTLIHYLDYLVHDIVCFVSVLSLTALSVLLYVLSCSVLLSQVDE